jgi:hypothetical protein
MAWPNYKLISCRSTQREGVLRISVALIYFFRRVRVSQWFFCPVLLLTSSFLASREFNACMYVYANISPLD